MPVKRTFMNTEFSLIPWLNTRSLAPINGHYYTLFVKETELVLQKDGTRFSINSLYTSVDSAQ
jgi:hypothetical protein